MKIGKLRFRPTRRGWTILALVALALSSYTADAVASIDRVRAGVKAGELSLGGMTRDEAGTKLSERSQQLLSRPVELFDGTHRFTIAPSRIGFRPNVTRTLDDAMGVGRRGNLFVRLWHRVRALFATTDVGWESDYDHAKAAALTNDLATQIDTQGHEAGIEARGTTIVPIGAIPGRRLDHAATVRAIIEGLESWPRRSMDLPVAVRDRHTTLDDAKAAASKANDWVRSSITLLAPDGSHHFLSRTTLASMVEAVPVKKGGWHLEVRFSPKALTDAVGPDMQPYETPAKSASFAVDGPTVRVVPGQNGKQFDANATARALAASADGDHRPVAAAFSNVAPKLSTQDAESLHIKELVSSFTTHYPCCQARVTNIHKIADTVDGAIVKPGATFSLNGYVGQRTPEKGYVMAPMIYDGEYKDDTGGGVSQFATTLFNAVFFGGYRFETFQAHSYYISRYPAGREATVSWPRPDLQFTNNTNEGILIKTAYDDTSLTVTFYGDKEGKVVTAESSPRTNITQPKEKHVANPDLPPGQQHVKQAGEEGFDITVTRVITQNGKTTRQEFFTRYDAEPKIIEFGPGPSPSPTGTGGPSTPGPVRTPAPATPHPTPTPSH
jgi:vancomycin resistance protein YoaR